MTTASVVGIATGYGLDDRGVGVQVSVGSRIFSSLNRPDRLWGPPNFLSNGYRWLILRGKAWSGRGVKLTTHLQLVPRSRKCGSIHPLPIRLHGVVLNWLSTGTTSPLPQLCRSARSTVLHIGGVLQPRYTYSKLSVKCSQNYEKIRDTFLPLQIRVPKLL
jgi:hypothetical protein